MNYRIELHKQAVKDYDKIKKNDNLNKIVKRIFLALQDNPYALPYEKLSGNLSGLYSKRINRQHRLVYMVLEDKRLIRVLSMWTHYETL